MLLAKGDEQLPEYVGMFLLHLCPVNARTRELIGLLARTCKFSSVSRIAELSKERSQFGRNSDRESEEL